MKRKQSNSQLNNLKPFTVETAREMGSRGGKKKKENEPKRKALEQIKNEIVEKCFSKVNELLSKEDISSSELRDLFKEAVNMSGFKSQTQDLNITPPTININGLNI